MLNRLPFRPRSVIALCLFYVCTSLYAQTFRIEGVVGNTLNSLDSTAIVTYTVRLENASAALHNVVPVLTPPACSLDNGASYFSATYAGANGVLFPSAIGTWNANTTKTLSFYVHLFNEADLCDGSGGVCDPGLTFFELSLTHDTGNGPVIAQDPDDHLLMRTPGEPVYQLEQLVYDWKPVNSNNCLTLQNPNQKFETNLAFHGIDIDRQDDNTRVVLAMNWSMFRFDTGCHLQTNNDPVCPLHLGFGEFNLGVNTSRQVDMPAHSLAGDLQQVEDPLLDIDGEPLDHATFGGVNDVNCIIDEPSTNYFDLTDLTVRPSGSLPIITVKEAIGIHTSSDPVTMSGSLGVAGVPLSVRSIEIYVATRALCVAGEVAFGATPSAATFHIANFEIASNGQASASLVVPAAWRENGHLLDDYTVEWYLTGNALLTSILDTGADDQSLDANFNIFNEVINLETLGLDLTDLELEAVVRYTGASGSSFVSTKTKSHAFAYAQTDVYQNQETGSGLDDNLDPGESRVYSYTITNTSGSAVSGATLSVDFSAIGDTLFLFNGQIVSNSDLVQINLPTLNAGASSQQTLDFQLIQTSLGCSEISIPVTLNYTAGLTDNAFANDLEMALNCGVKDFTISDMTTWTPQIFQLVNGVEIEVESVPGQIEQGWSFSGGIWSGQTFLPQFYYTLTSPAYPAGLSGSQSLTFQHTHRFRTNRAGGVLEYNVNNGFYQDLILELEGDSFIYNVLPFPDRNEFFEEYIANRRVWMDIPPTGEPFPSRTVTRDVPANLFGNEDGTVSFSFLYQDVLNESVLGDPWDLESFSYTYTDRIPDDYFRVSGVPEITQKVCNEPVEITTANNAFNYTFSFYTSINDLINNLPTEVNTSGFWQPPLPDNPPAVYYIKIAADNSTNPTTQIQRIFPIQVSAGSDCDPCGALDRNSDGTLDPVRITTDWVNLDITALVTVVNTAVECTLTIPTALVPEPASGRSGGRGRQR